MKATVYVDPSTEGADFGVVFGARGYDIQVVAGSVTAVADLLAYFSGAYTIEEVAARSGVAADTVASIVDALAAADLVYDYAAPPTPSEIDRQALIDTFARTARVLRFDLSRHDLFPHLSHERVFLASAIEYFHLIRDAGTHTAVALQHAPPPLRPLLEDYRRCEADHHRVIGERVVAALGGTFTPADLLPLASTESLMLKTRDLAATDTLAYLASCTFAEAPAALRPLAGEAVTAGWSPESRALLDAFVSHAIDDGAADHRLLFEQAVAAADMPLSAAAATRILVAIHDIKHGFDNMNYEILRTCTSHGAPLPRLRPRLADFVDAS